MAVVLRGLRQGVYTGGFGMTRINEINNELRILDTEICVRRLKIDQLSKEKAGLLCPYKVGDIITNTTSKEKAVLVRIDAGYKDYVLQGRLIKKDGSEGKMIRELWHPAWREGQS